MCGGSNRLASRPRITALLLMGLLAMYGSGQTTPGALTITRLHYGGGGDWYADPSSLPNLLAYIREKTGLQLAADEKQAEIGDDTFWASPYLYLTGHGNISFSEEEVTQLRTHLLSGGFLHADDNYGMDIAFRREMSRVFPDRDWVELPPTHPIFHAVFDFPEGLPKVHEHDGKRPQGFGLFHEERLIAFYTYECDLGDGWEDPQVHDVPEPMREQALKMGTNIMVYALTQ